MCEVGKEALSPFMTHFSPTLEIQNAFPLSPLRPPDIICTFCLKIYSQKPTKVKIN